MPLLQLDPTGLGPYTNKYTPYRKLGFSDLDIHTHTIAITIRICFIRK